VYVPELGESEARDSACKELLEGGIGPLDAEGAFELCERGVVRVGRALSPGVSVNARNDPVGAGDDPVEGGVVGIDEKVGKPPVVAAEGECVSVEECNPGEFMWVCEGGGCGDAGSERVAHEDGAVDVESLLEALEELEPMGHRVRAVALAVAEGGQVDCVDAVAATGEEWPYVMPDPGGFSGAAKEHEGRTPVAPAAVGEERPVDTDERAWVKGGCRSRAAVGCEIEHERREGDRHDKREQP
jgi:hypothetical protein